MGSVCQRKQPQEFEIITEGDTVYNEMKSSKKYSIQHRNTSYQDTQYKNQIPPEVQIEEFLQYNSEKGNTFVQALPSQFTNFLNCNLIQNIKFFKDSKKIGFQLLWISTQISNFQVYKSQLETLFLNIKIIESFENFQQFMKTQSEEDKYFLLTSGQIGKEIIEFVEQQNKIDSVFILCQNKKHYQSWARNYPKIKLVTDNFDQLLQLFQTLQQDVCFEVFDLKANYHLRKYLYFYFIFELCSSKANLKKQQAYDDFFEFAKKQIEGNPEETKQNSDLVEIMEDLKITSKNSKMVTWYLKNKFFHQMIDNILWKGNHIEIFKIRIAIFQIYKQLMEQKIDIIQYPKQLYLGIILQNNDFEYWRSQDKVPLILQAFSKATDSKEKAIESGRKILEDMPNQSEFQQVLLEIRTESTDPKLIPKSISCFDINLQKDEYLTQLNTFLQLEQINRDRNLFCVTAKIASFQEIKNQFDQNLFQLYQEVQKSLDQTFSTAEFYLIDILCILKQWNQLIIALKQISTKNEKEQSFIDEKFGLCYKGLGQLDKSLEYFLKALETQKKLLGENHKDIGILYWNIGKIYEAQGELNKALEFQLKTLSIQKQQGETYHSSAMYYKDIGQLYSELGNFNQAIIFSQKYFELTKQQFGENYCETATAYIKIGQIYLSFGSLNKALEFSSKGLEIQKKISGEYHCSTAPYYAIIGQIYQEIGDHKKALKYSLQELEINKQSLGENNYDTAVSYGNVGQIYKSCGQLNLALEHYLKALEIQKRLFGENNTEIAAYYNNIAQIYQAQGDLNKALAFSLKDLEITQAAFGDNQSEIATTYNNIGQIYKAMGQYGQALEYSLKALKIQNELSGDNSCQMAISYWNVSIIYEEFNQFQQAYDMMNLSYKLAKEVYGPQHEKTINRFNKLEQLKKLI